MAFGPLQSCVQAGEAQLDGVQSRLAAIEESSRGRLGVGVIDIKTGRTVGYRGDERFPMCSTHKALSAAAVLARVDQGKEHLDRRLRFAVAEILPYSPGTRPYAGREGMTVSAICEAAVTLSDNTAANLMLSMLGGPSGLTAYLRKLGDEVTRLDRTEPSLNEAAPGDLRDTTSPLAMAATLNRIVRGDALNPISRNLLVTWLVGCKTGGARLRAGVPHDWRVGDKTGSGNHGTSSDVGILWPPDYDPVIVTAYITGSDTSEAMRSAAIAAVARAVVQALGG